LQARFDMGSIAADILELKAAIHADDPPARQARRASRPVGEGRPAERGCPMVARRARCCVRGSLCRLIRPLL
jgi:hypothetical protein